MKVLLLGATGLLGHNVLKQLVHEGHDVVALVRRPDAIRLEGGNWQTIKGSPLDYTTLHDATQGCDAVINCAGTTDMSLLRYEDYLPVNRDLCRNLVRLMDECGIRILVHTSTVDTIGYGTADAPADEHAPMREPFLSSFYARSKREGEEILLAAAQGHPDRHVVIVNPGFMIGPYDVGPSSGRLLLAAYRLPVMFAPRGGKAFVAAADVAVAIVNALQRGENGARYIATHSQGQFSIKALYKLQATLCGYRQCVLAFPDWLLSLAGMLGDVFRRMGVRTQLSSCNVHQLMVMEHYSNHRAVADLGMPESPLETAIADFYAWKNKTHKI